MIFDPHERGHYLTYVRYLLGAATDADRVSVVLNSHALGSQEFSEQVAPYLGSADAVGLIREDSYGNGRALVEDFDRACAQLRPDHIWIPSGDTLVKQTSLDFFLKGWRMPAGVEAEAGLIEIRFHRSPPRWRGHLRSIRDRSLLRFGPWSRLHTIDPTVMLWAERADRALSRRLSLVPDPVDPGSEIGKVAARASLGLPTTGRYVGSLGSHAVPRKGTDLLLDAFAAASLKATDRLLLAGPLGDRLVERLHHDFDDLWRAERIVTLNRYLNEGELSAVLGAMDLVCTPYRDHMGSSGIVLRAAQAGRPVLTPNQGWFSEIVPLFDLGYTGEIHEGTTLSNMLRSCLDESEAFVPSPASRRLLEYSASSNFAALWAVRLRERMGLAPDPSTRTWAWATQSLRGAGSSLPSHKQGMGDGSSRGI
jgi:glycosyltransferase involved in cell wall biosynthesis